MTVQTEGRTGSQSIISIRGLTKIYKGGHEALKGIDLEVREGEILALLGPNGAGKTTLISTICGLVTPTAGSVTVGGHDIIRDYRATRSLIGLVPQELTLGAFDVVKDTVRFSRGLFGMPPDESKLDALLSDLSLLDKKEAMVSRLSGGMKRRVLIAKALSHEPRVLFLDEPTAGVDVELRKDMWKLVEKLRQDGVTIILTTHYIEEAEEIADRVGVISNGRLLVIDDKVNLMNSLGKKQLTVELKGATNALPESLAEFDLELSADGQRLTYTYDTRSERTGITSLLQAVSDAGLVLKDLNTRQSSLEDIFVNLVHSEGGKEPS
ncbi:ABC transporter ATP-binding protein [Granulosicoccus sp. 3-233]|uniref:ABC transporter ATP-binding protein n=1 Tax=Granulosicoccus sp. 3-233 TaxID=3417969 RepID=UPI003D34DD0C